MINENAIQKEKHMRAFKSFAARIKDNPNVIGFLIYGSLAYGTVTKDSDIDLVVFARDGSAIETNHTDYVAYESGVEIHAGVVEVTKFKRRMEKMIAGDWTLSQFSKGILTYCKDESMVKFMESVRKIGENDAALGIIRNLGLLTVEMRRAKKWITALNDTLYAQQFLQKAGLLVAEIVMLLNGEHPDRESKPRAMELNPAIMNEVYVKPSTTVMTKGDIERALQALDDFIMDYMPVWSKPILDFLSDGESKTAIQFKEHFGFEVGILDSLASRGVIEKVSQETRIFRNSKLTLEEPAYVYIPKEGHGNV